MKAWVNERYGPVEVLRLCDVPRPEPGPNEALIRIQATTVNRTDCGIRAGKPFLVRFFFGLFKPRCRVMGNEFAGIVDTVGSKVDRFKPGDSVFGQTGDRFGAHAEFLCLPQTGAFALVPDSLEPWQAAPICDGAMLAWNYLREMGIQPGHRMLVNGASGAIGSAAVQIAKHLGAEVTAVCGTPNLERVKALGATQVIDYLKEDFTRLNERFDHILDAVGKSSFFRCRRLLKPSGRFYSTELGFLAQNPLLSLITQRVRFPIPKESAEDVAFFKELVQQGAFSSLVDRCYPFEEIPDATRYVETGQKVGNVVIRLSR